MATHSSILAWRIPRTEESGGLPSMGLHRVEHDIAPALQVDSLPTELRGKPVILHPSHQMMNLCTHL